MNVTDAFNSHPCLLVPVDVEALAVGRSCGAWTDLSPDFSRLYEGRILGGQLTPALFNSQRNLHRPGVHLHWALPDALARGRLTDGSNEPPVQPEFPYIPNRWMIRRIITTDGSREVRVRCWIVESDYLFDADGTPTGNPVTIPKLDGPRLFAHAGKCTDASAWQEQPDRSYKIELTALGYGDPTFAAYYPACRSMLGFHDPLSDADAETSITYLVLGWFSDPARDPLYGGSAPPSPERYAERLRALKWATDPTAPQIPDRIVCHGTIFNIRWQGPNAVYASAVPDPETQRCAVAVGNTSAEAMAALLTERFPAAGEEDLLNALQGDALDQANLPEELAALLHQKRFQSFRAERVVSLRKKKTDSPEAPDHDDVTTIPEALRAQVADLNDREMRCDRLRRELDSLRWELYAAWYKQTWAYLAEEDQPPGGFAAQIEALRGEIATRETRLAEERRASGDLRRPVDDALKASGELESIPSSGPTFHQPNDPVVLIAMDDVEPSIRHGQDGRYSREDLLHCRASGCELSAIVVDIPNGHADIPIGAADLFDLPFPSHPSDGDAPVAIAHRLTGECLLLNPAHSVRIAEAVYIKDGLVGRPGIDGVRTKIVELQRRDIAPDTETPVAIEGHLPSPIALRDWTRNPWLPLLLEWRVSWRPSYDSMDDALARWSLGPCDYEWTGPDSETSDREFSYEGHTLMSPHATARLKKALKDCGSSDLGPVITQLGQMTILSQTLGGLTDAFLMRDWTIQIPPIRLSQGTSVLDPIAALINNANDASPAVDKPFLPIRAGHAKLLKLAVVDAFGQTLDLPESTLSTPLRAASVRAAANRSGALFQLPPRIAQPLRLRFDWPTRSTGWPALEEGPVCGWIIPNHLDKSLLVCDRTGLPLGALQKILRTRVAGSTGGRPEDVRAYFWTPCPGTNLRIADVPDADLRKLAAFIADLDADTGDAFWNLLNEAFTHMDSGLPEDAPLLSVLVGKPLAVVRSTLTLELSGLPAHDQAAEPARGLSTGGFTRAKFPLLLGEANNESDGLVGFFRKDAAAGAIGAFHPAAGARGTTVPGRIEYGVAVELDCETPRELLLLMAPEARVFARTGILPKTYGQLPPPYRLRPGTIKNIFFQAAPVLGQSDDLRMPKPSDDFGTWSWACRPRVTLWQEDSIQAAHDRAGFAPTRQEIFEGWLKLDPKTEAPTRGKPK